jgi:mRNA interferase MazF
LKRGEIWWADLGAYRAQEQTGRRPVIVWQSDTLIRLLQSVLVVPLTTNLDRAKLAGTALIVASDDGLPADPVALAFQLRAIPKAALKTKVRSLSVEELAELDLATDEAIGRVEPQSAEPHQQER